MAESNIVFEPRDQKHNPNASSKFFDDTTRDDYMTKRHKQDDLKIRKLNPKPGEWVNFKSEFNGVWHQIIKVYEPEDYFATIYFYKPKSSTSDETVRDFTYYENISHISKTLPSDTYAIFDETGAYSERRGNLADYFKGKELREAIMNETNTDGVDNDNSTDTKKEDEEITPQKVQDLYSKYHNKSYFISVFGTTKFNLQDEAYLKRMYYFLIKKSK